MLKELLNNHIYIQRSASSWEDAIRVAAAPLEAEGVINQDYVEAMIKNVIVNGSYIVIVPGFAMPHARPEEGALKNGLSFLKLDEPVKFPEDKEVKILIVLSAVNSELHLDLMGELADVLMDEEILNQLFEVTSPEAVLEILG